MRFLATKSLEELNPISIRFSWAGRKLAIVAAACFWAFAGVLGFELAALFFFSDGETHRWELLSDYRFMAIVMFSSSLVWLGIAKFAGGKPKRYLIGGLISPLLGAAVFSLILWILQLGILDPVTSFMVILWMFVISFPITWGISFAAAYTCLHLELRPQIAHGSR